MIACPRAWCAALASALLVLLPGVVHAGNDDELLVGNHAAMMGGAVGAIVRDASATWYNPAGLGSVVRDQVDMSSTVYTVRMFSAPDLITTQSGASDDGSVTELVVAPTQIAFVRRLAPGIAIGIGYFSPDASNYLLRETLNDERGSPPSDWQIARARSETQHIGALGLGIALSPTLRLGLSVIGGYATHVNSLALYGAVSEQGMLRASNSLTLVETTTRFSMQVGPGLQWDVSPNIVLGLALRSPEVQFYSVIDRTYNASVASTIDTESPLFGTFSNETQDRVGLELMRAGRAGFSLGYRYAMGAFTAEIDYQPALHRRRNNVDRKAVVNARVGWYHALNNALAFGVGLFTDRSSAADEYGFVDGSGDYYGGTFGLELSNEHWLAPNERAESLVFKTVFAFRYAYTRGEFGRVVGAPQLITQDPFTTTRGRLYVHELGLYVGGGLQF
ncbi:MAG: hypothetical protein ABW321_33375 [Polyangiales bacterium]